MGKAAGSFYQQIEGKLKAADSFHQQTEGKFKEETSKLLLLEHSFILC
jgi:uncharacterized protein YjbJ (UPF0337 family)